MPKQGPDTHTTLAATRVDAALLFDRAVSVPKTALREMLNEIMGPSDLTFAECEGHDGLLLSAGRLHIQVAGRSGKLPEARTAPALQSRLPHILGEDWRGAVRYHTGAITLSAGLGPDPRTLPALDEARAAEALDLLRTVVHVAATYMASCERPMAVLWDGSEQMFGPDRFLAMGDMLFPLPLFLHPKPTADARESELGFDLIGAEDLIGMPLTMEPAEEPFGWLVGRALAFVAHARAQGSPLPVGDSFGLASGERFDILRSPEGGLALRLVGDHVAQRRKARAA